jgi:hypothetical protein
MNTDTGRWTYVPTIEDSFPFNASKYERINLMKRNGDGNSLSTVTPGASVDSIPMRTKGGALRGNTNFTGVTSEAEKQQVLINMQYLENKVIDLSTMDYGGDGVFYINNSKLASLPLLRVGQEYLITGWSITNHNGPLGAYQIIVLDDKDQTKELQKYYIDWDQRHGYSVGPGYHKMLLTAKRFFVGEKEQIEYRFVEISDNITHLGDNNEDYSLVPPTINTNTMYMPTLSATGWIDRPEERHYDLVI